jgi:uncharacterized protein (DUF305 family)
MTEEVAMRARVVAVLAVAVVVLAGLTAAAGLDLDDDHPGDRMSHAMLTPQWQDQRAREPGWQARGWTVGMPGTMRGAQVDSEYGYLVGMVAHHREAVAAAEELERSDRPRMRALGESIVESQSAQIEQMQSWLAAWYPHRSGRAEYHAMMRDLSRLRGDRLDLSFLDDMTVHHMAAVTMSQQILLRGIAVHPEVTALARRIRSDQHAEMVEMQHWRQQWFGQGWRHWNDRWDEDRRSDGRHGWMSCRASGPGGR